MNKANNEKPFYDCNLPKEIPGYELIELSEDIYKYKKKIKEFCEWEINDEYEDGFIYYTDCKINWYMQGDGSLKENSMNFCPKCGKRIREVGVLKEERKQDV